MSQYPISRDIPTDIPTKYGALVHPKTTSKWPSRGRSEAREPQYGVGTCPCQMRTGIAAQEGPHTLAEAAGHLIERHRRRNIQYRGILRQNILRLFTPRQPAV